MRKDIPRIREILTADSIQLFYRWPMVPYSPLAICFKKRRNTIEIIEGADINNLLVARICGEQEMLFDAIGRRDLGQIFMAFANDPLVICGMEDAKKLFDEMCRNTEKYLTMYDLKRLRRTIIRKKGE